MVAAEAGECHAVLERLTIDAAAEAVWPLVRAFNFSCAQPVEEEPGSPAEAIAWWEDILGCEGGGEPQPPCERVVTTHQGDRLLLRLLETQEGGAGSPWVLEWDCGVEDSGGSPCDACARGRWRESLRLRKAERGCVAEWCVKLPHDAPLERRQRVASSRRKALRRLAAVACGEPLQLPDADEKHAGAVAPEEHAARRGSAAESVQDSPQRQGSGGLAGRRHWCHTEICGGMTVEVSFETDIQQEAHINAALQRAGTPPGSPAAQVAQSPLFVHPRQGSVTRLAAHRTESETSAARPPSSPGGSHRQTPQPVQPVQCPLFPGVPCVPGTEAFVEKANLLLEAHPVQEVLSYEDVKAIMRAFDATHGAVSEPPPQVVLPPPPAAPPTPQMPPQEGEATGAENGAAEAAAPSAVPAAAPEGAESGAGGSAAPPPEQPPAPTEGETQRPDPASDEGAAPAAGAAEEEEEVEMLAPVGDPGDAPPPDWADPYACPEIPVGEGLWPLTIVGDIHGQLPDLLDSVLGPVLRGEVRPSRYLFLGDYVDRGPRGLDAFCLLAVLRVCFPEMVTLLRGNHEDAQVSRVYGFWAECESKYPDPPPPLAWDAEADGNGNPFVWLLVNQTFPGMAVAALVRHIQTGRTVFCCHGGLSPVLAQQGESPDPHPSSVICRSKRRRYGESRLRSCHDPWVPLEPLSPTTQCCLDGLLWSDPVEHRPIADGEEASCPLFLHSERGCGFGWTERASRRFCEQHGFDFICRAHQMVLPGYLWQHCDKVLTLFSASNYCGVAGNLGAVLEIDHEWWPEGQVPCCRSYNPPPPPPVEAHQMECHGMLPQYFASPAHGESAEDQEHLPPHGAEDLEVVEVSFDEGIATEQQAEEDGEVVPIDEETAGAASGAAGQGPGSSESPTVPAADC